MTIIYTNCVSNNFYKSFNFFSVPKLYCPINYLPDTAPIPVLERNYNNSPLGLMQSRKDCEIFVKNAPEEELLKIKGIGKALVKKIKLK